MTFFVEGVNKSLEPQKQVRRIGEFKTVAEAVEVAQKTVDAFLQSQHRPGMEAKSLFAMYQEKAEFPFIFRDDDRTFNVPGFNHVQYSHQRIKALCEAKR